MEDALVMALMASTQPMFTAKAWQAEYMEAQISHSSGQGLYLEYSVTLACIYI